jgi:hypothetical protein
VVSLGILSEATDGTMCPGVDSASKNEYQDTTGGEDLATFIVPKVEKIRSLNLPDPQGPAQACSGGKEKKEKKKKSVRIEQEMTTSVSFNCALLCLYINSAAGSRFVIAWKLFANVCVSQPDYSLQPTD